MHTWLMHKKTEAESREGRVINCRPKYCFITEVSQLLKFFCPALFPRVIFCGTLYLTGVSPGKSLAHLTPP